MTSIFRDRWHKSLVFRASLWLAALGPFFFLSYGFANWFTAHRAHVPSIVFPWERHIPFLPWTIVPYWSVDFFYAFSFFIYRDRKELDSHAKRLLAAQIISVTCFLLFPLRFTFHAPPITQENAGALRGVYLFLFHALGDFDRPFNQAPSLHLSLTTILWVKYSQHTRGLARFLLRCWFVLAGLSTLTTYQHHFIDILPGIWVGLVCIALFPVEESRALPSFRSVPVAWLYFAAGGALAAVALEFGGVWWLLFWPAASLWIIALAYWMGAPTLLQRIGSAMDPAMVLLLAPYIRGKRMHARWSTRRDPIAHEIASGVWLGRFPLRAERDALKISSIVNLAAELPVNTAGVAARTVPMLDLVVPTAEQLDAAVAAIDELRATRPTVVCCAMGRSRSAAAVAAWLVASDAAVSVDEAIDLIYARRPEVVLTRRHRDQLQQWARSRFRPGAE